MAATNDHYLLACCNTRSGFR